CSFRRARDGSMTATPRPQPYASDALNPLSRLLRERDQLFLLQQALADVERARAADERLDILVRAVRRLGYGRVETIEGHALPPAGQVAELISNSSLLTTNELLVPLRAVDGTTIATLVLAEPASAERATIEHVRTVELF